MRLLVDTKRIKSLKGTKVPKDSFKRFIIIIFFHDKILHVQKNPKEYKALKALKAQKHNQSKAQKRK